MKNEALLIPIPYFQNPFPIFRSIPRKLKWIRNFPLHMCSIIYFNITAQLIPGKNTSLMCCHPLYHCNWAKVKKSRLYATENHRIASSNQQQPTWFWLLLFLCILSLKRTMKKRLLGHECCANYTMSLFFISSPFSVTCTSRLWIWRRDCGFGSWKIFLKRLGSPNTFFRSLS